MAEIPSNKIDGVTLSSVGPGHRLRDARKLGNLDQSDIATQLNLDIATINALEKDDYSSMPPAVFVRGYLRAYAGMVGLSADEVLASFDAMQGVTPEERNYRAPTRVSATGFPQPRRRIVPLVLLAVIVIALAIGGYWWWQQQQETSAPTTEPEATAALDLGDSADSVWTPAAVAEVANTAEHVVTTVDDGAEEATSPPLAEQAPESSPPPVEVTPAETSVETSTELVPETVEAMPTAASEVDAETKAATNADTNAEPNPRPTAESLIDHLTLSYSDNCWTQVRDAAGKRLAFGVMKPGQVVELSGVAPFDVTLGQTDGVSVTFNGKPFDHKRFSRGKIARFQIADEAGDANAAE